MTRASLSGVERLDVSGLTHTQLGLDEQVEGGGDGAGEPLFLPEE